jgi:hypothetical protein
MLLLLLSLNLLVCVSLLYLRISAYIIWRNDVILFIFYIYTMLLMLFKGHVHVHIHTYYYCRSVTKKLPLSFTLYNVGRRK